MEFEFVTAGQVLIRDFNDWDGGWKTKKAQ